MKTGEVVEYSMWLSGTETEAELVHYRGRFMEAVRLRTEWESEHEVGPWAFETKRPGDDRVPEVPDNISGPDVRLLVATAKLGAPKPRVEAETPGIVQDLTDEDLANLRRITRQQYRRAFPGHPRLTDRQCDSAINQIGPGVIERMIRGARGSLH